MPLFSGRAHEKSDGRQAAQALTARERSVLKAVFEGLIKCGSPLNRRFSMMGAPPSTPL
jgi:hypothetical protein